MIRLSWFAIICFSTFIFDSKTKAQIDPYIKPFSRYELYQFCTLPSNAKNTGLSEEEIDKLREINEEVRSPYDNLEISSASVRAAEAATRQNGAEALVEVKAIYGPKRFVRAIQLLNRQTLMMEAQGSKINDPTYLLFETLSDKLRLSERQIEKINRLNQGFAKELETESEKTAEELRKKEDKHFKEVFSELDSNQKGIHEKFFGKPIDFQTFLETKLKDLIRSRDGVWRTQSFTSSRNGKPDKENPVNSVWIILMQLVAEQEGFQKELELTKDQREKIKEHLKSLNPWSASNSDTAKTRLIELIEAKHLTTAELEEILLEHQLEWVLHLEAQVRLAHFRSSFGLLHPIVRQYIDLKPGQEKNILKHKETFEAELAEDRKQSAQKRREIHQRYIEDALAVLSRNQKESFQILLGVVLPDQE